MRLGNSVGVHSKCRCPRTRLQPINPVLNLGIPNLVAATRGARRRAPALANLQYNPSGGQAKGSAGTTGEPGPSPSGLAYCPITVKVVFTVSPLAAEI